MRALPGAATVRDGVNALSRAYQTSPLHECLDVYVQAAATGLTGREPYLTTVRYGFQLDLTTDRFDVLARGVDDLAAAAERLATG